MPAVAGGHDVTRAASRPLISNARTGRLNPRSVRSPTGSLTTISSASGLHPLGDQDLPRRGLRAQPGGQVGDGADGGVVEPALEADPAERGVALRDADAEAEVVAPPCPPVGELAAPGRASRPPSAPPARRVVARHRVVEEHHQAVTGEVLERPLEAEDQVPEGRVVLARARP